MKMLRVLHSLLSLFVALHVVKAYKPVVFMHGILSQPEEADTLFKWIKMVCIVFLYYLYENLSLHLFQL